MPSQKEITARVRAALTAADIKVRVRMTPGVSHSIQVFGTSHAAQFFPEEIRAICQIASDHGLTFVRGLPIVPEAEALLASKNSWEFYL